MTRRSRRHRSLRYRLLEGVCQHGFRGRSSSASASGRTVPNLRSRDRVRPDHALGRRRRRGSAATDGHERSCSRVEAERAARMESNQAADGRADDRVDEVRARADPTSIVRRLRAPSEVSSGPGRHRPPLRGARRSRVGRRRRRQSAAVALLALRTGLGNGPSPASIPPCRPQRRVRAWRSQAQVVKRLSPRKSSKRASYVDQRVAGGLMCDCFEGSSRTCGMCLPAGAPPRNVRRARSRAWKTFDSLIASCTVGSKRAEPLARSDVGQRNDSFGQCRHEPLETAATSRWRRASPVSRRAVLCEPSDDEQERRAEYGES